MRAEGEERGRSKEERKSDKRQTESEQKRIKVSVLLWFE